jgi:two-component sensor histidine kinase
MMFSALGVFAQEQKTVADKIAAIVGEDIILQSEIENKYNQAQRNDTINAPSKCNILAQSVKEKLHDSVSRIQTIGSIHELLYQSDSFSKLDIDKNIKKLVTDIAQSFQPAITLDISFDLQTIDLIY